MNLPKKRQGPWARRNVSYPPRPGNRVKILIDGQAAYGEIAAAFRQARQFIYMTICYGDPNFLPVPASLETFFGVLRSCQRQGIDVRMVIWQPQFDLPNTMPAGTPIPGVNEGEGSIQARWDKSVGYMGWYMSPRGNLEHYFLYFPAKLGCQHQKTYVMDDGADGVVAFVGGINPVQSYWDTQQHDMMDVRRVAPGQDLLQGLENNPPLHDVFYRLEGPAAGDVVANFVERYNGASYREAGVTTDVVTPAIARQIAPKPGGVGVQVLRTIAPGNYEHQIRVLLKQLILWALRWLVPQRYREIRYGDRGIREFYLNALMSAGEGSLIYIENQYFFDYGITHEIHEAAERGAKIIALLTARPDEGMPTGWVETILEKVAYVEDESRRVRGHRNVAILSLGNSRPDPRVAGKIIYSDTYLHAKTMAIFTPEWTAFTGGSANIAFTSMWFTSEMNIALMDRELITEWVAELWSENLQMPLAEARDLLQDPPSALAFFKEQAARNLAAMQRGENPEGRVYPWETQFPPRDFAGIDLSEVKLI
jgi:cardiolipin synthase A/B